MKFAEVDNHNAVKVGGLRQSVKSFQVGKPKLSAGFPGAVVREGADELTLRGEEGVRRTFIDTTNVQDQRRVPPLVDVGWHACCQAMFQGIEGQGWEAMRYHHKELHQAVRTKKHGDNPKAKALWALKAAKDK